jgi:hypothetical protein
MVTVLVRPYSGNAFKIGTAIASAYASTCTPICGSVTDTETIKIQH